MCEILRKNHWVSHLKGFGAIMGVRFVRLAGRDGKSVYVNPELVRTFYTRDDGQTTSVYFDEDHSVVVYTTPEGVFEAMAEAAYKAV
jgi:hypothetical protein